MAAKVIVFEDAYWQNFLPLTYWRATFQLQCGITTLLDKVAFQAPDRRAPSYLWDGVAVWCRDELTEKVEAETGLDTNAATDQPTLLINGRGIWHRLPETDNQASSWVGTTSDDQVACIFADAELAGTLTPEIMLDSELLTATVASLPHRNVSADVDLMSWPWEIIHANERAIVSDWRAILGYQGRIESHLMSGSHVLAPESVHIGAETQIKPCVVIDAEDGPVWIGERVTILPHSYIKGPAFIGDGSLIQPGSAVHAGTSIGVRCKVGGEVESSILQGYSNKQHDGFLGHSYIGSWVNIAADCINSDLKNTYGTVRVPINGSDVETGEMFMGMIVGDFSKLGINVSFPTGAVIGFCCSVVASRTPKYVPSFTWMNHEGAEPFHVERGLTLAQKVMRRRNREMTLPEQRLFAEVHREMQLIESLEEPGKVVR